METVARETTFRCKPDASPAKQALAFVLLGGILGAFGWFGMGHVMNVAHIAGWLAGGIAAVSVLGWIVTRNPLLWITIDDDALTIVRSSGTKKLAWSDIEAARFQEYAMPNTGGQTIVCLLVRARGESYELTPDFADDATRIAFEDAMLREIDERDIPGTTPALPSFERVLSLAGAWTFAASIAGLLAAHVLGYHTLGTIVGVAMLLTGSVIAWMTRGQRISRIVLAATVVLILGGTAILWACHVNVREVLNHWEWTERRR